MADERKAPNLKNLPKLRDRILTRSKAVDNAREDMKEIYLDAKDKNFHVKALKLTMRLYNMEPGERNDFLASLNAYCDALGITGSADMLGHTPTVPQPAAQEDPNEQERSGFIYAAGQQAAREGKVTEDNPWSPGTPEFDKWALGHADTLQAITDGIDGRSDDPLPTEPPAAETQESTPARRGRRGPALETVVPEGSA